MRPLGLLIIWKKTDPMKWEIMKTGLYGYYQNGLDYVREYAHVKEWKEAVTYSLDVVAYEVGDYRIELSLVQATGVDLSKETYLEKMYEATEEAAKG
jgi:hypothetical protein